MVTDGCDWSTWSLCISCISFKSQASNQIQNLLQSPPPLISELLKEKLCTEGGDVEKYNILFWLKCSIGLCFFVQVFFLPWNQNWIWILASAETNPALRDPAAFLSLPWLTAFMVTSARIKIICASWYMCLFEHGGSLSYIPGFYWCSKLH